MPNKLTDDINFLFTLNPLIAEVYKDIKYHYWTYREIAEDMGIKSSEVRDLYKQGKYLLRHREIAWCHGLSTRAINAITNKYKSTNALCNAVLKEDVDLEELDGVGHKVAMEIRRWCINHS